MKEKNTSLRLVITVSIIFMISLVFFLIGYTNQSNNMKLIALILGIINLILIFIDNIKRKRA